MTHSSQLTQVLGTIRNERVGTRGRSKPEAMRFLVFEDNGGQYVWNLVAADGQRLAESTRFGSFAEAKRAAGAARVGAGSAAIEDQRVIDDQRAGTPRPDPSSRSIVSERDDEDAEPADGRG